MSRNNLLLAIVLIAQLALAAFLLWPRSAAVTAAKLLPAVNLTDVTSLSVQDSTTAITVTKSGEQWVLPANGDFPVKETAVTDVISKVLAIDTRRLVASNPGNFNQLKVADGDFERKLTFGTSGGQNYTVVVGTSPSARSTNIRLGDQNNVYATDKLASSDLQTAFSGWIDTSYFKASAEEINAASLTNASGSFELSKDITGTWQLAGLQAGETFSSTVWSGWVNRVANLTMTEPLGKEAKPEYGMDSPQATLTIVSIPAAPVAGTETVTDTAALVSAPVTTTFTIGAEDTGKSAYYVKSSASEYYVRVSSFTFSDFVKKSRSDLVLSATAATTPTTFLSDAFTITAPISDTSVITGTEVSSDVSLSPALTATQAISATEAPTSTEPITSAP